MEEIPHGKRHLVVFKNTQIVIAPGCEHCVRSQALILHCFLFFLSTILTFISSRRRRGRGNQW